MNKTIDAGKHGETYKQNQPKDRDRQKKLKRRQTRYEIEQIYFSIMVELSDILYALPVILLIVLHKLSSCHLSYAVLWVSALKQIYVGEIRVKFYPFKL